jgi:hypothetical protein
MSAAKKEKKPIMRCASSGHITKLKLSIFAPFDIYGHPPAYLVILFVVAQLRFVFIFLVLVLLLAGQ